MVSRLYKSVSSRTDAEARPFGGASEWGASSSSGSTYGGDGGRGTGGGGGEGRGESSAGRERICIYFARGFCHHGTGCKYKHVAGGAATETATEARSPTGICHKFAQTGQCTYAGCRYRHEAGGSATNPPPRSVPHGVCRWFGTLQGCRFGDSCTSEHRYVDSPDDGVSDSDSKTSMIGRPPAPMPWRRHNWAGSLAGSDATLQEARPPTGICHKFAQTGRCTYVGCRYRHEAGGSATNQPPRSVPHGVCRWFGTLQGCRFGDNCNFEHRYIDSSDDTDNDNGRESDSDTSMNIRRPAPTPQKCRNWAISLERPDATLPSVMKKIVTVGLRILNSAEPEARQSAIKTLGSDIGRAWVAKVLEATYSLDQCAGRSLGFHEHCVPFMRLIAHEQILASLVLEKDVEKIYDLIRQRGVDFFDSAASILQKGMGRSSTDGPQLEEALSALSAIMLSTVDLDQDTYIKAGYTTIVTTLGECLDRFPADSQQSFALRSAARHIQRIKERLYMGYDALDARNFKSTTKTTAKSNFYAYFPGRLSLTGPRHDNDHASIEEITVLPTTSELKADRPEFLPEKYETSPHHETGVKRLLDTQFRLLREDTSGQVRDAIRGLVQHWDQLVRGSDKNLQRAIQRKMAAKISMFKNATLKRLHFDRKAGLAADVVFAQPENMSKMDRSDRADWWEGSKDLQRGSIVALIDDTLETSFLLVHERTVKAAVDAWMIDDDNYNPEVNLKDLAGNEREAMITLSLIDPTSKIDQARLVKLASPSAAGSAVLVEFPGLLFVSFQPVLKGLQALHKRPNLPFTDWLAPGPETQYTVRNGFVEIPPPLYMSRKNVTLDLSCITEDGHCLSHSIDKPVTIEELEEHTTLDRGQCEGLISSLQREFALVQGPPGTGKSYVGDKIVQVLLANRHRLRIGPIICVCYTNHALDQFLEHILKQKTPGVKGPTVIRLGSKSKSEALAERTLYKARVGKESTPEERRNISDLNKELDIYASDIQPVLHWCSRGFTFNDIVEYLQLNEESIHDHLFAGAKGDNSVDEEGYQTVGWTSKWDLFNLWIQGKCRPRDMHNPPLLLRSDRSVTDLLAAPQQLWQMSIVERRKLWGHWEDTITTAKLTELEKKMAGFDNVSRDLQRQYKEGNQRCLEEADVIGVTTTGVAMNAELLKGLPAKVLICEEAAEVLQAHLLTALIPSVEHAVLIGDHLQLRAQISNNALQMENPAGRKYGLDESVFERLADGKFDGAKFPIATLNVQRRMHPSIASLVGDTLYPHLQNHESTERYPNVVGMRRRLFWLDHRHREDSGAQDTSKSNKWEADMVVSLVKHLALQGAYHRKEDIAVLTPYLGQLRILRSKFAADFNLVVGEKDMEEIEAQEKKEMLAGKEVEVHPENLLRREKLSDAIRIATVDNFQGEEAKIIVISLVRSNEEHKCGFLKTDNRINVLLSRAQHGMYIIGDSETARGGSMWVRVVGMLEKGGNIGSKLALQCPRHPDTNILVEKNEDFRRLAPEGGCTVTCGNPLKCGHACKMACHAVALHDVAECREDCDRRHIRCRHPCPKRCFEDCGNCMVAASTAGVILPCGHTPKALFCYEKYDLQGVLCRETVQRSLDCGHTVDVACYRAQKKLTCKSKCGSMLPCRHQCMRECSDCRQQNSEEPAEVIVDHKSCLTTCGKPYTTCSHACVRNCHPGTPCGPCDNPCEVACVHSRCTNKCSEPCPPCPEPCKWSCKHNGECHMPCAVPCDRLPCSVRCDKMLACGHQCPSICGEDCPDVKYCWECTGADIFYQPLNPLGLTRYHKIDLVNNPVIFLACGHICSMESMDSYMRLRRAYEIGDEAELLEPKKFPRTAMKTCPACRAPLRNIHRYNRVVKGALADETTKRFMAQNGALQTKMIEEVSAWEIVLRQKAFDLGIQATDRSNSAYASKRAILEDYKFGAEQATECVAKFLAIVAKAEQPYGRIQSLVLDARRRGKQVREFELDNTVIQPGFELRGRVQALRVAWAVLSNFQRLGIHISSKSRAKWWKDWGNDQLQRAKDLSAEVIVDAEKANMRRELIEALIYHARFVALELDRTADAKEPPTAKEDELRKVELRHLGECLFEIDRHPSAEYLRKDANEARLLLSSGMRFSFVTATGPSTEKEAVYSALRRTYSDTTRWYFCPSGHPFSAGGAVAPPASARCADCNEPLPLPNENHTVFSMMEGLIGRIVI